MAFLGVNGLVLLYAERKVAGFIQRRPGPYEVGPHGLLQPFADAGKLISKQLVCPRGADRVMFWLGAAGRARAGGRLLSADPVQPAARRGWT